MSKFDVIAFDADDTLWQNERYYRDTETRFIQMFAPHLPAETVSQHLYKTETQNIEYYGYGVKSFALSMVETALEFSDGSIPAATIDTVLQLAKSMLKTDVELLDQVAETIKRLSKKYRLMVITKGDLLHQESKIALSGLAPFFKHAKVVSTKTPDSYKKVLDTLGIDSTRFLMVGNSLRSDILPILTLGGHAVYIPHDSTWAHENAEAPPLETNGYFILDHIGLLPALLERIDPRSKSS